VDATVGTDPDAAVSGGQHGEDTRTRQPLAHGEGGDRDIPKAIEAAAGRDPDTAFTILEEPCDGIAGQAVRQRKDVRPTLMEVHEALAARPNPQAAIPIPKHSLGAKLSSRARQRIGFRLAADEPSDAVDRADQQPAVLFVETLNAVLCTWHGMKFRRTRLPPPQAVRHGHPQGAGTVLVQAHDAVAETASSSMTLKDGALNRADLPVVQRECARPYRAFTILEEGKHDLPAELRNRSQPSALPDGKPLRGADPQTAVGPGVQAVDLAGWES